MSFSRADYMELTPQLLVIHVIDAVPDFLGDIVLESYIQKGKIDLADIPEEYRYQVAYVRAHAKEFIKDRERRLWRTEEIQEINTLARHAVHLPAIPYDNFFRGTQWDRRRTTDYIRYSCERGCYDFGREDPPRYVLPLATFANETGLQALDSQPKRVGCRGPGTTTYFLGSNGRVYWWDNTDLDAPPQDLEYGWVDKASFGAYQLHTVLGTLKVLR